MVSRRLRFSVWWRRAGLSSRLLVLGIMILGFVGYHLLSSSDGGDGGLGLLILNFLIVILGIFGFLIGRNVVKLVFDRSRGIFGAQLRTRLVLSFVGLTLVPLILTFLLASGLVRKVFDGWFAPQVEAAVEGALQVARSQLDAITENAKRGSEVSTTLVANITLTNDRVVLDRALDQIRAKTPFFSIRLVTQAGVPLGESVSAASVAETVEEPSIDEMLVTKALSGKRITNIERRGANQFVRVYEVVQMPPRRFVVVSSLLVDPDLSSALTSVSDSYRDYQQLKRVRATVQSGYTVSLGILTALILFGAVWVGFFLSRQISEPLRRLAEGTEAVSKGNLSFRLLERGRDEFSFLTRSFNRMTLDLSRSREESEARREEIEAIITNLSVGIVRLTPEAQIISMNESARKLLEVHDDAVVEGKKLTEMMPGVAAAVSLESIVLRPKEAGAGVALAIPSSEGGERKILANIGAVRTRSGGVERLVLVLDDVTEISRVEHEAAWREVARRVAHEIKNPLTPLQLSAQRLSKIYGNNAEIEEIAQVIMEHVQSIRRLVTEFSMNVRLPETERAEIDLNRIIGSAVSSFAHGATQCSLQFIPDPSIPTLFGDAEQLRRMIVNLIDNAVAAVSEADAPKVSVRSFFQAAQQIAFIEVIDNGPGISDADRVRVFEPYFTRKSSGTGLGLSIVASVVAGHGGEVTIRAAEPTGAIVSVALPVKRRESGRLRTTLV